VTLSRLSVLNWDTERLWEFKVTDAREEELKWRVRENIVATLTGFIWFVFFRDIRHDEPDEYQDLDTFRYSAIDLPLLYFASGGEIVRF